MNISLQTLRKYAKNPEQIAIGKNGGDPVFYYFDDLLPYAWADDVCSGIRHTGWFTNADGETFTDGSGEARGIVAQLPPAPGFPSGRFLAGYWAGDNGESVIWPELYKDENDAARMADEHARIFAESALENSEKYAAAQKLEIDTEDATQRLRECLVLRNVACMRYVRDEIAVLLETIRSNRDALRTEYANYI